jgi:uncharacterized protein (TIGR02147 family)
MAMRAGMEIREPEMPGPDVLDYSNYRNFLQDWHQARKSVDPDYSLRQFARDARFSGHTMLKYVMEGKRNLTKRSFLKLAVALGLTAERAEYFENLVFFNQASSMDEKDFYYRKLLGADKNRGVRKLEQSQFEIFRTASPIAIREMLDMAGFRNSPNWIADRLIPAVDPQEVRDSLNLLLEAGLIKKTPGGFKSVDEAITTHDEVMSVLVRNYHVRMLDQAKHALDNLEPGKRDISSVCFKIREEDFSKLKKQIQLIRKDLRRFAVEGKQGERVVQVSIQMFPLTKGPRDE